MTRINISQEIAKQIVGLPYDEQHGLDSTVYLTGDGEKVAQLQADTLFGCVYVSVWKVKYPDDDYFGPEWVEVARLSLDLDVELLAQVIKPLIPGVAVTA